jgi:MoaA/NifB/PqqE/SkfB family radical SAM enzyme
MRACDFMLIITEGALSLDYARLFLWRFRTFFIKHNSLRKIGNYSVIKAQKWLRKNYIIGHPYELIVEVSSKCIMKCPNCLSHDKRYPHALMPFERFKSIIDMYYPYIYNVELFNWGEPLLNKEIFKMIRYAKNKNLFARISSNFNAAATQDCLELIHSGLDYVKVSIDGASQKTYGQYRKKGDFRKVISSMRNLIQSKKLLRSKTPYIEWQFIVNKYNEHEIGKARLLAGELGVDRISFTNFSPIHIHAENNSRLAGKFLPQQLIFRKWAPMLQKSGYAKKGSCRYLWESRVINSNSKIILCPNRIGSLVECGDVNMEWNSPVFISARRLFSYGNRVNQKIPCAACREFEQPWKRSQNYEKNGP